VAVKLHSFRNPFQFQHEFKHFLPLIKVVKQGQRLFVLSQIENQEFESLIDSDHPLLHQFQNPPWCCNEHIHHSLALFHPS